MAQAETAQIKVFAITEEEWWAGLTLEECIAAACDEYGMTREQLAGQSFDDPYELSDEGLVAMRFIDEECDEKYSFQERLRRLITDGCQFPCFFATTEG